MGEAKRTKEAGTPPRARPIERCFETYLGAVYGELLPMAQLTEVRRAFYAGARGVLRILAASDGPDEARVCADVEVELVGFIADVERGTK